MSNSLVLAYLYLLSLGHIPITATSTFYLHIYVQFMECSNILMYLIPIYGGVIMAITLLKIILN